MRCPECDYSLTGLPHGSRCPECGKTPGLIEEDPFPRNPLSWCLYGANRLWFGITVVLGGFAAWIWWIVAFRGSRAAEIVNWMILPSMFFIVYCLLLGWARFRFLKARNPTARTDSIWHWLHTATFVAFVLWRALAVQHSRVSFMFMEAAVSGLLGAMLASCVCAIGVLVACALVG